MDNSLKEIHIRKSFRKFLIDSLNENSPPNYPIYFEFLYDIPKDINGNQIDQWFVFSFGPIKQDTLSNLEANMYIFSRRDIEGDKLAEMTDTVYGFFSDDNMPDGNKRIPLYNTEASPWEQIGTFVLLDVEDNGEESGKEKTKFRSLTLQFKWGALF